MRRETRVRCQGAMVALVVILMGSAMAWGETGEERLERGRVLLNQGKKEPGEALLRQAVMELHKAYKANPKDEKNLFHLGRAYFYLAKDKEARACFQNAAKISPQWANPHYFLGLIHMYNKEADKAIQRFTKACALDPKTSRNWLDLGRAQSLAGRKAEALASYRKAAELDPSNADALYGAAVILAESGKEEEALALLRRTLSLQPQHVNATYNLAQLYQKRGMHKEALATFQASARLEPLEWRTRAKIIQEHQALGQLPERDRARQELLALRRQGKVPTLVAAKSFCRDQITVADKRVMVYESFALEGKMAVMYSFEVMDRAEKRKLLTLSLGCYEETNAYARESGQIKPGERLFHLDGYYPGGEHRTYGFFTGEPPYDRVRAMVVEILSGKRKAISGTKPQ